MMSVHIECKTLNIVDRIAIHLNSKIVFFVFCIALKLRCSNEIKVSG